jgi:tetratricopeptide (TPR) repeat protein
VYTAIKKLLSEEDKERRARLKKEKKAARKARWKRQDNSIESQVRAEFRMTFFQRACLRGSSRACLEWMKMEPQKVDPQHFLRGILLRRKQWKQVLPLCKMLAKRKKPHFEDQLCLAETLAALGKHLKAQQQYTTLLKQYPNHGPTWLALGELEWKRDLFPQAERACRKATVLLPSSSEAWECLARSLLSQKNRKKETLKAYHKSCTLGSSTACQKVLKLRPKGVRGWWWWGTTVARMGSRGISLETVRRSCQLGVASACINLSREMLKKAKSLLKHNQPARANGWYQRATTVAPTFAPAWREKGLFLVSQKQWPSACSSLATSLRLNPRQPKLWTTLSICYKKRANLTLLRSQKALKQACALGINTACQQLKK